MSLLFTNPKIMCQKCNWFAKLFGCKGSCQKKDEVAQPVGPAPTNNESQPAAAQPENVEKTQ